MHIWVHGSFWGWSQWRPAERLNKKGKAKQPERKATKKHTKMEKKAACFFHFTFFFCCFVFVFCYSAFAKKSDFLEPGALFWLFTIE